MLHQSRFICVENTAAEFIVIVDRAADGGHGAVLRAQDAFE